MRKESGKRSVEMLTGEENKKGGTGGLLGTLGKRGHTPTSLSFSLPLVANCRDPTSRVIH